MINWTEISDGDTWELFARDFLGELGFVIEIGPGRGADGGRDLVVAEQLKGKLRSQPFRWLVSCKNFARSNKSVGPSDEENISDRLRQHGADGFMGFYSTMPSAALVERLVQFEKAAVIKSHELFDHRKIEAYFVDSGLSQIALRYFPDSYRAMRPIQRFLAERVDLNCFICDKDLLVDSVRNPYGGIIVWPMPIDGPQVYEDALVCCKGECNRKLEAQLFRDGYITGWEDISDLCNPILYLKNLMTYINITRADPSNYSDKAHNSMKEIYIALSQRTLREITKDDIERFSRVSSLDGLC